MRETGGGGGDQAPQQFFKIVILGESAVGKSSLLNKYVYGKFSENRESTIQAAFASKTLYVDDQEVRIDIWDTAGQEQYHALGPIYYRGSNGALLVYDITDPHSFKRVKNWVVELQRMLSESCALFVVGNKVDLEHQRAVDREEVERYAKSVDAQFAECSAKDNTNVDQTFEQLTRVMLRAAHEQRARLSRAPSLRRSNSQRQLRIVDEVEPPRSRKCC